MATTINTTLDVQDPQEFKRAKDDRKKKPKGGKKQEGKNDASEVECFNCSIVVHYANRCPHKQDKQERKKRSDSHDEDEARLGHVTWADASTFSTYQVNLVSDNRFARTEVLIDNAVDVSIIHPWLLRNIMSAEKAIKINGVGGHQFTVTETGYLDPFFSVYASKHTNADILSFCRLKISSRSCTNPKILSLYIYCTWI